MDLTNKDKVDFYKSLFKEADLKDAEIDEKIRYFSGVRLSGATATASDITNKNPVLQDIIDKGETIDPIRNNSMITPLTVATANYLVQGKLTRERSQLIDGKMREVYTYERGNFKMTIVPPLGVKRGLEPIFETVTDYYDFWDINHLEKEADIDLDTFLDYKGYRRDNEGVHDRKTKKNVWEKLVKGGKTPCTFSLSGGVFTGTLITVIGYYDNKNDLINIENYIKGKPPKRFRILAPEALANQMRGYKNNQGKWQHKEVLISGKIPIEKENREYLGYIKKIKKVIDIGYYNTTKPIRFFKTSEIDECIGGQKSLRKQKRKQALNTLEADKFNTAWGYSNSHNKKFDKSNDKMPMIWIDRSKADSIKLASRFGYRLRSEKAKEREKNKIKEAIKGLSKKVTVIKKRQDDGY